MSYAVNKTSSQTSGKQLLYFSFSHCILICIYSSFLDPGPDTLISKQDSDILKFLQNIQQLVYHPTLLWLLMGHCISRFACPLPRSSSVFITLQNGKHASFVQDDFAVSFQIFLRSIPPALQMTPSAIETNRCFFLHLGVAVGIHPFALQCAFRIRTRQLMARPSTGDFEKELLSSIIQPAALVDANALAFLWPQEFSQTRLCILSGRSNEILVTVLQANVSDLSVIWNANDFLYHRPLWKVHRSKKSLFVVMAVTLLCFDP